MDPVSFVPATACVLIAITTASLIVKQFGSPPCQGRFASIDGLRGYLAFFVFLHHSCVWYFYLRTGQWKLPPSNLYTHFGQSSVLLFFMITGFLFFTKLIDGKTKTIDWGRLFVSRFLRLVPLYLFAMFLLFLVVAYISNWKLNEPVPKLLNEASRWLGFTIFGMPNLNGVGPTFVIVAGVTWSLPYEWFFYLSLPLLALTVRMRPSLPYIALSVAGTVALAIWHPQIIHLKLLSFSGGITASILVRSNLFRQFAVRRISSFIALGCIAIVIAAYPSGFGLVQIFLLSVAFTLIACGNHIFGFLLSPASRLLGEIGYSIYLLHGILLFIIFIFIFGVPDSKVMSPITHWFLVAGITPILIFICFITFRLIENPAMANTTNLTSWLRSRLTRSKGSPAVDKPER